MSLDRYATSVKTYGPPAAIFDDSHANPPDLWADATHVTRAATTAPTTWDPDTMTVEVIAATQAPVMRKDARGVAYAETLDMATLDLSAVTDLPVYDSHRGASARDVVGIVQSLRVDGDKLLATLRLSAAEDAAPIVERVAEGTLTGVSIGYAVAAWRETHENGQRVRRPASWTLREISLTPDPADRAARVRSETAPSATARLGGNPSNRAATGGTMPNTQTVTPPEDAERTRRSEIRTLVRSAGLGAEIADDLIDQEATVDAAKAAIFDHMQTRSTPVIRTTAPQNDDPAVITRRQADAVATRMAGGECPEVSRQYLGDSMLDLARSALSRAGVSHRGMSADETFQRAAHGTSDFPLVVSNAMNKVALDTYKAAESPLKSLCRQRTLSNFKESTSIRLGEMGRLEEIDEHGEITHTSRAENGETMRLKTYARGLTVSRQLLIDDDLGLLGDMTAAFGEAAAQTEADILVDLLTSNPSLSDGTAVFHSTRGNLADTGADPSVTTLDLARKAMRGFKGLDGKTLINSKPKYLLVGPELETAAESLLASIYAASVDDVNPFTGKLTLLVEPRITDDRWFIFADPARLPALQFGYLSAAQGVQIQRTEAWDTLGMKYRAFLDFGAGWLDWRGAYFNEGAA
ncbi:prohead protease/major capsid protein fusion protein [Vannielia litorea]|uniref:Phage prohead protease, HK97 family n=1 Tax=Vannielia litorea TaxID=1217970 RepID=A0A1N6FUT3_9RHOB|nr:prohead protease/major capsid protein fusion protein [Vannielia litorea]SIN98982.1 phage prohead protease, HK97 family [Vannielia litorea]